MTWFHSQYSSVIDLCFNKHEARWNQFKNPIMISNTIRAWWLMSEWKAANPHFILLEAEWSSALILFSQWLTNFCMCLALCVLSVFLANYAESYCLSPLPDSSIIAQPIAFSLFSHFLTSHGQCSILQEEASEVGSLDSEHITVCTCFGFQIYEKICVMGLLEEDKKCIEHTWPEVHSLKCVILELNSTQNTS